MFWKMMCPGLNFVRLDICCDVLFPMQLLWQVLTQGMFVHLSHPSIPLFYLIRSKPSIQSYPSISSIHLASQLSILCRHFDPLPTYLRAAKKDLYHPAGASLLPWVPIELCIFLKTLAVYRIKFLFFWLEGQTWYMCNNKIHIRMTLPEFCISVHKGIQTEVEIIVIRGSQARMWNWTESFVNI